MTHRTEAEHQRRRDLADAAAGITPRLTEALLDALRVARSRGDRLSSPAPTLDSPEELTEAAARGFSPFRPGLPRHWASGVNDQHGRGLALVASLTERWGAEPCQRAQRFICGRRTLVPDELVRTVLSLVKADDVYAYTREDMFATLVCTIELHRGPVHYGAALNLRGPEAGTLWALWRDGGTPSAVIEIADCPAGREADSPCSEFAGHPGGHSWELDDPPRMPTAFPLERRPPS